jgi:uncharacterized membrane protein (DUF485 family)
MDNAKQNLILLILVLIFVMQFLSFIGFQPKFLSSSASGRSRTYSCDDAYAAYRGATISGNSSQAGQILRGATANGCDTSNW